jgi:NAD(P)H-dependent FMN reductase
MAIGTAALSSVATQDMLPALIALGAEGLYLGVLSASKRFQRAVRATTPEDDEVQQRALADLQQALAPSQREHYQALVGLKGKILDNYRKLPGGRVLAASSEPRLDTLLQSFLKLLGTLNQYRTYLNATDRKQVQTEVDALKSELAGETNPRLQEVKGRRVDILEKRLARFHQAEESREVVSHQLAGIEDLLRLTHEQSIAIRDPASVNRQLDALAAEAEASDETVKQMERFMEFSDEMASTGPMGTRVR